MRRVFAIVIAVIVVAFAIAAHAQSASRVAEAKRHLDAGNKLYLDGRYDDAVRELRAGYAIDARPDFLYALGQAERKRGDCKAAVRYYQAFVDTGQSPQRTVAVLVQIDRCKQELAAAPATPQPSQSPPPPVAVEAPSQSPPLQSPLPPVAAPPVAESPPASPPPVADAAPSTHPSSSTKIYKRWWLWTIVGVAAAGAAVGLGVGLTQQHSFDSTLPDLVVTKATVRF
jgi:hypothetical protein